MIRLANQVGVEPWFSVPYNADDNYITNMANLIHDQLRPDLVRAGRLFSVCGCSLWVAVCVCVLVVGILIVGYEPHIHELMGILSHEGVCVRASVYAWVVCCAYACVV